MSPTNRNLSHHVDGRLAAYATLAGVALAAPAFAPSAEATIIYSGTVNLTIASTTNGLYLNVLNGAINEPGNTGGSTVLGWDINPWNTTGFGLFSPTTPAGGAYVITAVGFGANLAPGTLISAASLFGSSTSTNVAQWNLSSSNNIFGFRFLNESTGLINYGWAQVSFSSTIAGQPRLLVAYAYDDTGAGILAGAVPEPTTFALLGVMAGGALGVRAWRKRKAA